MSSTERFRYATGHYNKLMLWEANRNSTTITLSKNAKYDLMYAQTLKLILCFSNSKTIEVVDISSIKILFSFNLENTPSCSCIVKSTAEMISILYGPYLNYVELNKEGVLENSTLLDKAKQNTYMCCMTCFQISKYVVTLNNSGKAYLFSQDSDSSWHLVTQTSPQRKSGFELQCETFSSLIELSDDYVAMDSYLRRIYISKIPGLAIIKTVNYPTTSRILNLGVGLGEDILISLNQDVHSCYFILPFNGEFGESREIRLKKKILLEDYLKTASFENTVVLYTKRSIYQISVFD